MIQCSKCGYHGVYTDKNCPECNERFVLTPEQIDEKVAEIERAEATRQYELAAEGHHILADMGRTESQKEYAYMLEKGNIVTRNLDEAMKYYYMAAEKNDAYAALKYARLAERHSDKAAMFWLMYSAALGCIEAYPVVAEKLAKNGEDELANYYYALSAAYDDTDSIVTLAKRYYTGTGIEQSLPYAKWYMDKLTLPPFHAIKMAYKLRSVRSEDPGLPKHPDLDKMLRRLAMKAYDYEYASAYHNLNEMLSDRGDLTARVTLAMLWAEGIGCKQNPDMAMKLLSSAAEHGSADACKHMGDIYLSGELVPQSVHKALACYKEAAALGMTNAYETMGDIFYEGKMVKANPAAAIELYDIAAKEGHSSAREKSNKLKDARENLCKRGMAVEQTSPEEAFRCFAVSANMGYLPAYRHMARCFREGIGTKKNRAQCFLWSEKAAESKNADDLYEYGLCYARGIGTAFNLKRATEILFRSAKSGSADARAELERLMNAKRKHMMDSVYSKAMRLIHKKKFAEAEELLRLCLKFEHAKGIYTLGCLNEFGLGIHANRELAFKLYEKAFDLKFRDPKAEYKLAILKKARTYRH